MSRSTLRPSPNEEAQMMQDELQRRRKLRILQVREQEKANAIRIRRATQEKHEKEINILAYALEKKWKANHQKELRESEEKFTSCLKDVGSAHEDAKENEPNQALKDAIAEKNQKDAEERGVSALKHERQLRRMRDQESIEIRRRRHVAMIKERVRAKHIANLPPPHPNPADFIVNDTTSTKSTRSSGSIPNQPGRYATIQISDHESTMTTTVALGLPTGAVVERATAAEVAIDAREEAKKEGERMALLQAEKEKATEECMEKARVRHQTALEEARLGKESQMLLQDLKQLTMKDGLRRQYHIDYKWDDNVQAKKACQELFGPPGARFKESEMLSSDLQNTDTGNGGDHSTLTSTGILESQQSCDNEWQDVSQEQDVSKPGAGRSLNRLLKQINAQRQQQRNATGSISNLDPISEDTPVETASPDTESEISTTSDVIESVLKPGLESETLVAATTVTITEATDSKSASQIEVSQASTDANSVNIGGLPKPEFKSQKKVDLSSQSGAVADITSTERSSDRSKSQSELLLENSLQNMRNDEALLKSVKDFQTRLLQQHKSCAKIQQQIDRLESKRAAIDAQVDGVIKR